jgi:hypothetical protein
VPKSPVYTMRRTWPDNPKSPNDFVFRCDGVDVGRCYFTRAARSRDVWLLDSLWNLERRQGGYAGRAKRKFKETFEGSRERLSPFGHPQV